MRSPYLPRSHGCADTWVHASGCNSVCLSHFFLLFFTLKVVSDSLPAHGRQHTRLPCPSASPRVFSGSCPLSLSNHIEPSYLPQSLLFPSVFPSIKVFSSESSFHIRWPKYWSFSFSISPSNEYVGLISFRIDWFDLLAVQGTVKIPFLESPWKTHCKTGPMLTCTEGCWKLNGNLLQCSCLENPRDGGAWWAAVYGVAQSRTRLKRLSSSSDPTSNLYFKVGEWMNDVHCFLGGGALEKGASLAVQWLRHHRGHGFDSWSGY